MLSKATLGSDNRIGLNFEELSWTGFGKDKPLIKPFDIQTYAVGGLINTGNNATISVDWMGFSDKSSVSILIQNFELQLPPPVPLQPPT